MMDVEYYTRINGKMKLCQIREPYNRIITHPWTYYGTPMPALEFVNFPVLTPINNQNTPFTPLIISDA